MTKPSDQNWPTSAWIAFGLMTLANIFAQIAYWSIR